MTTEPQKINAQIHFGPGITPPDGMPVVSSAEPMRERIIETFRSFGVGEDVLQQVRERKPITEQEYNLAQHRKASLMQDKAWLQKWFDGNADARREMATLSIILGSNILKDEKDV